MTEPRFLQGVPGRGCAIGALVGGLLLFWGAMFLAGFLAGLGAHLAGWSWP